MSRRTIVLAVARATNARVRLFAILVSISVCARSVLLLLLVALLQNVVLEFKSVLNRMLRVKKEKKNVIVLFYLFLLRKFSSSTFC